MPKRDENKHFPRIRKNDDSVFSKDDARELIKAKKKDEAENQGEVIGKKKDIIAQQINALTPQKLGTASIADIFGPNPMHSAQTNSRDKSTDEIPQKYRKYDKLLLKLKNDLKMDPSKLTTDNLAISVGDTKQDLVDHETNSFDSEFVITLMSNEQEILTEVEEALQRIYNGIYGICELTGKLIEPQRLLAVPFARFSIEGQMEKEKEKIN